MQQRSREQDKKAAARRRLQSRCPLAIAGIIQAQAGILSLLVTFIAVTECGKVIHVRRGFSLRTDVQTMVSY